MNRGTGRRRTRVEPALRFASDPGAHPLRRMLRALPILAGAPRDVVAILRARLTGKRVRARQALAALLGLDHRALWCGSGVRARLVAPRRPEEVDRADTSLAVILAAPEHTLLPGAAALIEAAFTDDPTRQALYGDALIVREDGAAMPLLRPAFDRDYLMAIDYVGPVIALRYTGLAAIGASKEIPARADATELILRLDEHFGSGAIAHLPRLLSRSPLGSNASAGAFPTPQVARDPNALNAASQDAGSLTRGEGGRAPRGAIIRAALDRTGGADVAIDVEPDGVLTLRHPVPAPPPLVSLIVPTRDRLDLLRPCIASLLERTDWPAREILICDNASREPETLAYLRDLEARGLARIVAWPGPFDFAGMNNAAARVARGQVLAFVNNDVEARHPDWLERLVREALRPDIGAVGAKLIDRGGRIQHGGVLLGPGGLVTHAHRFFAGDAPGYLGALSATHAVSAVTAACLVVAAAKFAEVGGFDAEAFAVDFNDVDLCLRLGRAGYRTLFVPGAVLSHFEAASRRWTPESRARHLREVAAFQKRWGPLLAQDPHYHPDFDPDFGTYARLRPGWSGIETQAGPVRPR